MTYQKHHIATNNERGALTANILLVLLLVVIGVLIYLVSLNRAPNAGRTIGTSSPEYVSAPRRTAPAGEQITADDNEAEFDDGLAQPESVTEYPLNDVGEGIASIEVFRHDINNDGRMDKITRTRTETGTSHFSYQYKVELNTENGFVDITPDGFDTIEGAECSLQKIRFSFTPAFQAVKISRPWNESWATPTDATRDTYSIIRGRLYQIDTRPMGTVCDVAQLF